MYPGRRDSRYECVQADNVWMQPCAKGIELLIQVPQQQVTRVVGGSGE